MYKFIKTVKQLVVSPPSIIADLTLVSMVIQGLSLVPLAVSMVIQGLSLEPSEVTHGSLTIKYNAVKYNPNKFSIA